MRFSVAAAETSWSALVAMPVEEHTPWSVPVALPEVEDAAWLIMAGVAGQLLSEFLLKRLSLRSVHGQTETDGLCAVRCVGYQGAQRTLQPHGVNMILPATTTSIEVDMILNYMFRFGFLHKLRKSPLSWRAERANLKGIYHACVKTIPSKSNANL